MNNKILLLSFVTMLFVLTSCSKPNNWEYKTIYFESERFDGKDKGYTKGDEIFKNSVSSTSIIPSDAELNKLGKDGWEIASTYLEMETVFPNLLASGNGVAGLQSNIRPQRLVVIFKRPAKK
jgi:hypothetical protein